MGYNESRFVDVGSRGKSDNVGDPAVALVREEVEFSFTTSGDDNGNSEGKNSGHF